MPFGNITCIHANKTMPFISVYDRPIHAHTSLAFLYVAAPRYSLVLSHWGIPSEGMLQKLGGSNWHCVGQSTQNGVLGEPFSYSVKFWCVAHCGSV